ncbi:hypothetical protein KM043_007169 [Ampulex compressa]|nr:hypothetical protein KM043_007169 [Ampulex compressa]
MSESSNNPYDINSQHFKPDKYFEKLLKECTLKQIMDHEAEIIRNTQTLTSDMQTLVYENYNKFISATDTIRKMKTDFKEMEDSMDLLGKNMDSITSFSEQISSTLQGTRQQVAKLSSVHTLLKKLQFLFKLPGNLKDSINEKNYAKAVQDYIHARRVLNRYGNMPSFQGKRVEDVADTVILVRALDRFHRRLEAMNEQCKETDFASIGTDIVINAGRKQCRNHLHCLKQHLSETLAKVRQTLATKTTQEGDGGLAELQVLLVVPTIEKVKGVLQDLLVFLQPDLSFSLKVQFLQSFCIDEVREGLVVGFLHHLTAIASGFCTGSDVPKFPPTLLLLLSKMCIEYKENNVRYLLTTTDNLFNIEQYTSLANIITHDTEICEIFQEAAQSLLNHYVRIQGLAVSQMLRKSVETRDWLHTIEPRTVRAVMKRVVEDVTAIDSQVAVLYEDSDGQVDRSSDSSRKTHSVSVSRHHYRSNWSSYTPSHIDSSLMVTNIHKVFSERIEIFSSVQFNKASILTGIIKISLKTFLECVRLRTFSKYGLQQIQVDTHYLKLYLWRFVSDENVVYFLLHEILGSAVHRCLEPVLMEPSVVEIICERG